MVKHLSLYHNWNAASNHQKGPQAFQNHEVKRISKKRHRLAHRSVASFRRQAYVPVRWRKVNKIALLILLHQFSAELFRFHVKNQFIGKVCGWRSSTCWGATLMIANHGLTDVQPLFWWHDVHLGFLGIAPCFVPSGKGLHNYGWNHHFEWINYTPTISMAMFKCANC